MGLFKSGIGKLAVVAGAVIGVKYGMQYLLPLLRAKPAADKVVPVFQNFGYMVNFEKFVVRFDILFKNPANSPLSFTYPFTQVFVEGKSFGSSTVSKELITVDAFSQKTIPYSIEMKLGQALIVLGTALYNKLFNQEGTLVRVDLLTYIEGTALYTTSYSKTIFGA